MAILLKGKKTSFSQLSKNKRPGGLNVDAFFFKFAMIIIGLCAKSEDHKQKWYPFHISLIEKG